MIEINERRRSWQGLIESFIKICMVTTFRTGILAIQGLMTVTFVVCLSIVIYVWIYKNFVPRPITQEKIYFNFDKEKPVAYINLMRDEKQWNRMSIQTEQNVDALLSRKRFLKSGYNYNFDVRVLLAKSMRNFESGKVVLSLDVFDSTGRIIANSFRPIIMPYQSPIYIHLESFVLFPVRLAGFASHIDSTEYSVNMIDKFVEPGIAHPPTEGLQFTLSSPKIDLLSLEVLILPQLRGLVSLMYHYPLVSFIAFISIISSIQLGCIAIFIMVMFYYLYCVALSPNRMDGAL
jgi:hypothetical protein